MNIEISMNIELNESELKIIDEYARLVDLPELNMKQVREHGVKVANIISSKVFAQQACDKRFNVKVTA